jgi:flagellar biogenesis protein FliO
MSNWKKLRDVVVGLGLIVALIFFMGWLSKV